MAVLMHPVALAGIAAAANIVGGLLITHGAAGRSRSALQLLGGFGAGFILAVALLEMLPDAMESSGGLTAVLVGYLAVHLTQHALTPHFHFGEEVHHEEMVSRRIGGWALVGLLPHSFFDGVAISSGFLLRPELGLLIFLGVALHKVPDGIALASVMVASGNPRQRALLGVSALAVATVLGAALTPVLRVLAQYGLALAAGVTIYVAASNLIPEAQHQRGWRVPAGILLGVAAFYTAKQMLPGH